MDITQISVFLENRPNRLEQVFQVLADLSINIQTLTIAEMHDFGILRMIVDRPGEAYAALKANHITCSQTAVLAVALQDAPGALHRLVGAFGRRQINIDYMYAFADRPDAHAIMIFRFKDNEAAKGALEEEGYTVMKRSEIHRD
jgi:hypothetical protein